MSTESPQPNLLRTQCLSPYGLTFWFLVVATGVGSGLAAGLLMRLLRLVQHTAWGYRDGSFLHATAESAATTRVIVLALAGLLVAIVVPLLGRLTGGGPSELEATIWFDDGRLPPLKTAGKAVLSIVIVGLGASLGREAAPKQAGSLIGGLLAGGFGIKTSQRRLLVVCGAGAGIAAVYNVPFGAALFALEVLLGSLSLSLIAPVVLATVSGTLAGWLLLPNEPTYHLPAMPLTAAVIVWAIAFAPIGGVVSAVFVKVIAFVARAKPKGAAAPIAAMIVFVALGLVAIPYPQLLGNGKDVVELAALDRLALPVLLALALLKPLATAACLGTGAPGGLFTPTIAFGALVGGAFGHLWAQVWPTDATGAYALIGATAVLAATTKGPISALVLMIELTGHLDGLLIPMLIAVTGAVSIAHLLDPRSIYTSRLAGGTSAGDRDARTVSTATPVNELSRRILLAGGTLHVCDDIGRPVGTISRDDLAASVSALSPLEAATAIDVLAIRAESHRPADERGAD